MATAHALRGSLVDEEIKSQLSASGRRDVEAPLLDKSEESLKVDELKEKYDEAKASGLTGFQVLQKFHKIAPPLVAYDAAEPIKTLLRYSGSGLQMTFHCLDFWIFFGLHVVLSVTYSVLGGGVKDGHPTAHFWPQMNLAMLAIPGSLTVFVLVFYLNQAFSQYLAKSGKCGGALGSLGEFLVLLRVHMADDAFPAANVVRDQMLKLTNAMHILAITMHPSHRESGIDTWGWWFILDNKLLTRNQVEELKPLVYSEKADGRLAFREVLMWITRGIWAQQSKGRLDSKVATLFTYKLWDVRLNLEDLYAMPSGPIPFAYFHLLNFILSLYLLFLSYSFVFVSLMWSIPGFFLILVGLIGLRELGNTMSNPLGDDDADIPVFHNINGFLNMSKTLIDIKVAYEEHDALKPASQNWKDGASL